MFQFFRSSHHKGMRGSQLGMRIFILGGEESKYEFAAAFGLKMRHRLVWHSLIAKNIIHTELKKGRRMPLPFCVVPLKFTAA